MMHRGREMPKSIDKTVWEHLKDLTKERAEAAAKRKALHRAYSAGSVTENAFVSKDAHYTKLIEELDKEIDDTVVELSKAFLPEELQKRDAKLQELSDLAILSKKLEELKADKKELDDEKNTLYLQLTELEEDKKMHVAEKNKLRAKYEEDSEQLKEMTKGIDELEGQRKVLEEKVAGIQPRDQKIGTLTTENKMLRDRLEGTKKKLLEREKTLGVVSAVVDRHAKEIDEGKKKEELKELVQPKNAGVQDLAKKHSTPKEAFEFVRDNILEVHPQVSASYWMDTDDIMRLGAADPDDKAIFLCSLLRAQGQDA
jgi:chromosome segregation ATPase